MSSDNNWSAGGVFGYDMIAPALDTGSSGATFTNWSHDLSLDGSPVSGGPGDGTVVGATADPGVQNMRALIYGTKWSGTVSFDFPNAFADYGVYAHTTAGFYQVPLEQRTAVRYILTGTNLGLITAGPEFGYGSFANVANITYSHPNAFNAADISVAGTNLFDGANLGTARVADFPRLDQRSDSGDVWFGNDYAAYLTPKPGDYGWITHIHELGHSMGLKHGHDPGYGQFNVAMTPDRDSMEFSVMTYRSYVGGPTSGYTNETFGYAQTLMMYDIATLQFMYGADFTTNSTNTVYTFSPTTGEMFLNGVGQTAPGNGAGGSSNRIFLTVWDGNGTDTYNLSNYTTPLSLDLTPGGWSDFSVGSNTQNANLGNGNFARGHVFNALQSNGDARSLIENAIGGSNNDTILGNAAANTLSGGAGNDTISGGDGTDVLNGDAGVDTLNGDNGDDTLNGGTGNDTLDGGSGVDLLNGGDDNDTLLGSFSGDTLNGGAGDDHLEGGFATDTVDGGAGDDFIEVNAGEFIDNVAGGTGTDTLNLSSIIAVGATIDLLTGDWFTTPDFGGVVTIQGIERIFATQLTDNILGSAADESLYGQGGNDVIDGGAGNDFLFGGAGADTVYGSGGDDYIQGDDGPSSVLAGGAGNDSIYGGAGNDYIVGDDGNDTMVGLGGQDSLYGGLGDDYLVSGDGPGAVVDGGAGANTLWGGSGADYIVGGEGADLAVGGALSDYLFGNAGDDTLYGGQGIDYIYSNAGADFIWTDDVGFPQAQDFIYVGGGTGVDTVADFVAGGGANHDVVVISPASGIGNFAQVQAAMTQAGVYTVITMSGGDALYIYNVTPAQLTADNFLFI